MFRQFIYLSINFTSPEINDHEINNHLNLQWLWEDSNSWLLRSKLKTWLVELILKITTQSIFGLEIY
jgi:hypothetical protein